MNSQPIPTGDAEAWDAYPEHRWVYNKLELAGRVGEAAWPHGVDPPAYPVIVKPIYNLDGMGADIAVVRGAAGYLRHCRPGHMAQEYFTGRHTSTDLVMRHGAIVWAVQTRGHPGKWLGTFDYWEVGGVDHDLGSLLIERVQDLLRGYTGVVNVETIGRHVIEIHLRPAWQWADLYPVDWVARVGQLCRDGAWTPDPGADIWPHAISGYSFCLFRECDQDAAPIRDGVIAEMRDRDGIIDIVLDRADEPGPPAARRVAVINARSYGAGHEVRAELARLAGLG